jgi:hypothetical protein
MINGDLTYTTLFGVARAIMLQCITKMRSITGVPAFELHFLGQKDDTMTNVLRRPGMARAIVMTTALASAGMAAAQDAPPVLLPGLSGPLSYNPKPVSFDLAGSKIYVTGVASGYVGAQSNSTPGVASSFADVSNAQVIIQKPEGLFQFLVQAGLCPRHHLH